MRGALTFLELWSCLIYERLLKHVELFPRRRNVNVAHGVNLIAANEHILTPQVHHECNWRPLQMIVAARQLWSKFTLTFRMQIYFVEMFN